MPTKRRRACEACHAAKVRCELTILSSGAILPCRRCRKAGKDCVPTAPKLQRNRIAQLEAKVKTLETARQSGDTSIESAHADSETYASCAPTIERREDIKEYDITTSPLIDFAANVGIDIGISGLPRSQEYVYSGNQREDTTTLTARKAWLACTAATYAVATVIRQPHTSPWTAYHDECIDYIQASSDASASDLLFCQLVDAERLCHLVASEAGLCDRSPPTSLSHTRSRSSELKLQIDNWSAKALANRQDPLLVFYRHISVLYLNEAVLHTPTNKATFAAPFVPERITPADFAAPVVTIDHIGALYTLKDTCHAALDAALKLDLTTSLTNSTVSLYPRVLYAIFILVKLYVAVTAPGNTYGAVLGNAELRLEEYFDKFGSLANAAGISESAPAPSIIFTASGWLQEWFVGYKAIAEEYERRMSLQMIWTPSIAASSQKFGIQVQDSDHAIKPSDLIWMGQGSEEPQANKMSLTNPSAWKQRSFMRAESSFDNPA